MRLVTGDGERQLPRVAVAAVGCIEGSGQRERLPVPRERRVERGAIVLLPQCGVRPQPLENLDAIWNAFSRLELTLPSRRR